MELRLGVLIIGSLYWNNEGGRPLWREQRLNLQRSFRVKAPIRYGRKSKRGTYTMVFSRIPEQHRGNAIAI